MIDKAFRNRGRFLQIVISVLLFQILWWVCPISLIFGIVVILIAIYYHKKNLFEDKYPNILYFFVGIMVSIIWALVYAALELYVFQNANHPLFLFRWFNNHIAYWSLLIMTHFYIIYFITRNLSFSVVLTLFYCVNEDFSFWLFFGLDLGIPIMPPPGNWFAAFPSIFPPWFIELGTPLEIWPYVPIIYIIVWSITIPLIIVMIHIAKKDK